MNDHQYLSADIDPASGARLNRLKSQALALIRRDLITDPNLHDDAEIAVLADYDGMDANAFLAQLRTFSLILNHLEKNDAYQEMIRLLAGLLRLGICKVSPEALDAVTILRDGLRMNVDRRVTLLGTMNRELSMIVSACKETFITEKRLGAIEKLINAPTQENLNAVSHAFQLPVKETERIMRLAGNGLGEHKNCIRSVFKMSLEELAFHGTLAFELSWCVLKNINGRKDRIAFLNAMQHLIRCIQRPKSALRFLLDDFCRFPNTVVISDRNIMMLVNALLRTYNKELDVDIEITPEEVLRVRNGLDPDIVNYAQFRIDKLETRFAAKVRTIHEKLIALLKNPLQAKTDFSIRHLLFLEREIFIFLSLIAGKTAHLILISALNEYGDPDVGIYRYPKAADYLPVLLQQLKIIARGMGRIGSLDDAVLMQKISGHGLKIAKLFGAKENQMALARTMRGIEAAMRCIHLSHGQSIQWRMPYRE
ncbi:uncharacterized protein Dvar_61320 [Desulfosarcina variabilis str. Montpellier]|uniref:hypothetical protein n=1 Tax=Desulfosarcina variabilis TaxID=2300 RepID=UPI003AFA3801